jgi:hypothetical protein
MYQTSVNLLFKYLLLIEGIFSEMRNLRIPKVSNKSSFSRYLRLYS